MKSLVGVCAFLALSANAQSLTFGGDFFVTTPHAVHPSARLPQIVNLEGAWCKREKGGVYRNKKWRLCLDVEETLKTLSSLGVKAVSLENNHASDAGALQKQALVSKLEAQGIAVVSPTKPYCNKTQTLCAVSSYGERGHVVANKTIRRLKKRHIKVVHLVHRDRSSREYQSEADVLITTGAHRSQTSPALALGDVVMDCDCAKGQSRGAFVEVLPRGLRYWNIRVPLPGEGDQRLGEHIALEDKVPVGAFAVDGFLEFAPAP